MIATVTVIILAISAAGVVTGIFWKSGDYVDDDYVDDDYVEDRYYT